MPTAAEIAYERLLKGMVERTPGCRDIDAFAADHLTRSEIAFLEPICAACALQLLCRRYVDLEPPPVGFRAGQYYGPKNRPSNANAASSRNKPSRSHTAAFAEPDASRNASTTSTASTSH